MEDPRRQPSLSGAAGLWGTCAVCHHTSWCQAESCQEVLDFTGPSEPSLLWYFISTQIKQPRNFRDRQNARLSPGCRGRGRAGVRAQPESPRPLGPTHFCPAEEPQVLLPLAHGKPPTTLGVPKIPSGMQCRNNTLHFLFLKILNRVTSLARFCSFVLL